MEELLTSIAAKKQRLDRLRPFSSKALAPLEHYYDIELTYTSNAIEGNTLSAVETTLVIEKGITVGGKPLKDTWKRSITTTPFATCAKLAQDENRITESDVRNLHRLVMYRSAPEIAGQYADLPRCVRAETGRHSFPSPAEIPALMGDFAAWFSPAPSSPETAFDAHRRLVDIHPFNDGGSLLEASVRHEIGCAGARKSRDRQKADKEGRKNAFHSRLISVAGLQAAERVVVA